MLYPEQLQGTPLKKLKSALCCLTQTAGRCLCVLLADVVVGGREEMLWVLRVPPAFLVHPHPLGRD